MSVRQNLKKIQQAWWDRGFTCNTQQDPAQKSWARHHHDVDEIVTPIQGRIEIQVGDQRCRPAIGREVVVPAGVTHAIHNPTHQTVEYLYGFRNRRKKRKVS